MTHLDLLPFLPVKSIVFKRVQLYESVTQSQALSNAKVANITETCKYRASV